MINNMSTQLIFLISFLIVSILGVFLHFTHQIFKKGILVHIFSAINESTWEHNKLAFYPILLVLIIHYFIPSINYPGFIGTAFIISLLSSIIIPLLYYPIRYINKREITFVSISLYFFSIAVCLLLEYYFVINRIYLLSDIVGIIGILLLFGLYIYFTYFPPKIFLFKDPIFKKFGEFKQDFDKKPN